MSGGSSGSSPWASTGRDLPPDDLLLGDPVLAPLLGALTADPTPAELAGQDTAVAMYRAARAVGPRAVRRGARARDGRARARGATLAAVSTLAVVAGGLAAAGYAAMLPGPLQHVVHQIFGFPDARGGAATAQGGPSNGTPGTGHGAGGNHGPHGQVGNPQPQTVPGELRPSLWDLGTQLSAWAASNGRLAVGHPVVITATLTDNGRAVPGARLGLLEQTAGQPRWQLVTLARTGSLGTAALRAPALTANARFQVTEQRGTDHGRVVSKPVTVMVIPPVSLRVHGGKHGKRVVFIVRCPFAAGGDVVRLQVRQGPASRQGNQRVGNGGGWPSGKWQTEGATKLSKNGKALFEITAPEADLAYRVVLVATAEHGWSLSNIVIIARDMRWQR